MSFFTKLNNLNQNRDFISNSKNRFIKLGNFNANIDGIASDDRFGSSIATNAIGDRVVIGAPYSDINGTDSGQVRVFNWDGSAWTQLGASIDNIFAGDQFGYSVAMNFIGDRIVVGGPFNDNNGTDSGQVRIYSWNGTSWTQLGSNINGLAAGDNFGFSVSMDFTGDVVAIGAPNSDPTVSTVDAGQVRIFKWSGSTWTQLGSDINGTTAGDNFGYSVSIDAAGHRLVIGIPYAERFATSNAGQARVFNWNGSAWSQLGSNILNDIWVRTDDNFGHSVKISGSGNRVIIGGFLKNVNGSIVDAGFVKVYDWSGSWNQVGSDISGIVTGDNLGFSVAINFIGDIVAIGVPKKDSTGLDAGQVRIFKWDGSSNWVQIGADINGAAAGDNFGYSVGINFAGDRIAIGAPFSDMNVIDGGRVQVYHDYRSRINLPYYNNNSTGTWERSRLITQNTVNLRLGCSTTLNGAGNVLISTGPNQQTYIGETRIYEWKSFGTYATWGNSCTLTSPAVLKYDTHASNFYGDAVVIGEQYSNAFEAFYLNPINGRWEAYGAAVAPAGRADNFGYSVSMNGLGNRIAVGDPFINSNGTDAGQVNIFQWNGSAWAQIGSNINGDQRNQAGWSVSMNVIGDTVAIGGPHTAPDSFGIFGKGVVRIYKWSGSDWVKRGTDINGLLINDFFGYSVAMNAIGDKVVIGAPTKDANGTDSGQVRVFGWNGSAWTQLGSSINGSAGSNLGFSVSINFLGDKIVAGGQLADANGADSGIIRIYDWNGSDWVQSGEDINGSTAGERFGSSVAMNALGNSIAVGSPFYSATQTCAGALSIYVLNK